jgi:hypothetical protein
MVALAACDDGSCEVEPELDDGTWTAAGITLEVEGRTVVARYQRCGEQVVETWRLSARSRESERNPGFSDTGDWDAGVSRARRCLTSPDAGTPDLGGALCDGVPEPPVVLPRHEGAHHAYRWLPPEGSPQEAYLGVQLLNLDHPVLLPVDAAGEPVPFTAGGARRLFARHVAHERRGDAWLWTGRIGFESVCGGQPGVPEALACAREKVQSVSAIRVEPQGAEPLLLPVEGPVPTHALGEICDRVGAASVCAAGLRCAHLRPLGPPECGPATAECPAHWTVIELTAEGEEWVHEGPNLGGGVDCFDGISGAQGSRVMFHFTSAADTRWRAIVDGADGNRRLAIRTQCAATDLPHQLACARGAAEFETTAGQEVWLSAYEPDLEICAPLRLRVAPVPLEER